VFQDIDHLIHELKEKEINGMLLDRYTASYYQKMNKLKSLITLKKLQFPGEVGILLSKARQDLANCLNIHRSSIRRLVQTITSAFKVIRLPIFLHPCDFQLRVAFAFIMPISLLRSVIRKRIASLFQLKPTADFTVV